MITKQNSCPFHYLLATVPARVPRDLSAVGKTPEKSRRQKLQLHFPETAPHLGWSSPCSAPPGGTPSPPFDLLVRDFPSPARNQGSAPN